MDDLDQIYIIYPLRVDQEMPNFIGMDKCLIWDIEIEFSNGGLRMALFSLNKQLSKNMIQTYKA